mgnify:FL=1
MKSVKPIHEQKVDQLSVQVYESKAALASAAADFTCEKINNSIEKKGYANIILATGASQFDFLTELQNRDVNWKRITVFHLDEYKDMSDQHPASFRKYLKERILDHVKPKQIYFLQGDSPVIKDELDRYESLLKTHPIDIACIGIGENGHLAFNDPPVADFNDSRMVKLVELDDDCRQQQFGEGWFPTFDDVPTQALTLTIPAIMNSNVISCVVPDDRKAKAVYQALTGPIETACPASILRKHKNAILFLERDSATHCLGF